MKKGILVFFLFVGFFTNAQPVSQLFEQGNQFYKNADYRAAVTTYHKIEKGGFHSDALYFNLANAYYKLNEVAPSVYYYEKALKLNPLNEDAKYNLVLANRLTIDQIDEVPKTLLQRFETNFLHKFSIHQWAVISILFSIVTALLFLIYYFSYSSILKRIFFSVSIVTFSLMLLSVLVAYSVLDYAKKNQPAIVFSEKAQIKNAPTFNSEDVFTLHEGTKVIVLDEVDDWYKIKLTDGKIGWIRTSVLKII